MIRAMRNLSAAILAIGAIGAAPLHAKVIDQSEAGFTVAHSANVAASPDDVWKMLRMPQKWWSAEHSWSGNAENFWLDAQAGGCFCEKLPGEGDKFGSVQHARILFAKPGQMLRLSGALGPLQGEALTGTLTILIKPTPTGSLVRFDYVVGGYMRFKLAEIAPGVDQVIGQQLAGLAKALGGALPPGRGEGEKPASDLGSAVEGLVPEKSPDSAETPSPEPVKEEQAPGGI